MQNFQVIPAFRIMRKISYMIVTTGNILLIGSTLLFVSLIIGRTGYKLGIPVLLLFLIVGMIFGSDGVGIQFHNAGEAQFIGTLSLCIILFAGGMDTKINDIRPIIPQGVILATVGVLLTTFITGYFIYWLIGSLYPSMAAPLVGCLLLAAVMSSTDSASVFNILRSKSLNLKQNMRPLLELESGSNDPMAYMLTLLLIQIIQTPAGETNLWYSFLMFIVQMSVGAVAGFLLGKMAVWLMNRLNIGNQSLYPILLLACVFFIFSITELVKGNGYLAVYIAGLVVGNHKIQHKKSVTTFFDGFTWLFQIVMFLTLGLLVNPRDLLPIAGLGLLVGFFMIILARPISVFLCLAPFRQMSTKAKVYVSWVGLRGAVPIIFATYPLIAQIPYASLIFNVVFFITIVSLLIQGTTVSSMANLLNLSEKEPKQGNDFGMELPEEIKSAMSEIEVADNLLVNGNRLMDLSLPDNTLVVMVKRGNNFFIPRGGTGLDIGDKLLVITDNDEELMKTYKNLGINEYMIQKNS